MSDQFKCAPDFCKGCLLPLGLRVNLPPHWEKGDPIPENATIHTRADDGRKFIYKDGWLGRLYIVQGDEDSVHSPSESAAKA